MNKTNNKQVNQQVSQPAPIPPIEDMPVAPADVVMAAQPQLTLPDIDFVQGGPYIHNQFVNDIQSGMKYMNRKTGFTELDRVQRLKPGMYFFGGVSGLGKTTFLWQLADQIAAMGNPVIYVSLETPKAMMFNKSITRYINLHADMDTTYHRYTNAEIEDGKAIGSRELAEQMVAYENTVGGNLYFYKPDRRINVEQFLMLYDKWKKEFASQYPDNPPVVILDYLQILSPSLIGGHPLVDKKQNIDHAIGELVAFQTRETVTMIAVCSFNRSIYLKPVSYEAFKETGEIEYSADVMWGLQYAVVSQASFHYKPKADGTPSEKTTDSVEKNAKIEAAKTNAVREVQLVALKNRYGSPSYTIDFHYEPRYETFRSAIIQTAAVAALQDDEMNSFRICIDENNQE